MKTAWLTLALVLVALLAACGGGQRADIQGEWSLVSLDGAPLAAGSEITLTISADELGGSGGCNQYGGRYSLAGERMRIEDLAQTEMACLDQAVSDQEVTYMAALAQAERVAVEDNRLTLSGPDGELVYQRSGD